MNNVSPVSTAQGFSPRSRSVTTTETLSTVWPGVSRKRRITRPKRISSPSCTATCGNGRIGSGAQVDFRAGFGGQFHVAADEIGVQVSFDDVLDLEPLRAGFVEIKRDVALRVHHAGHTFGPKHVRRVRQAGQIELLESTFARSSVL